jgi:hypothetical protein
MIADDWREKPPTAIGRCLGMGNLSPFRESPFREMHRFPESTCRCQRTTLYIYSFKKKLWFLVFFTYIYRNLKGEKEMNITSWVKEAVDRHGINSVDTFIAAYPALSAEVEIHFNLQPCERDGDLLERLRAIDEGIGTLRDGKGQIGIFSSAEYIYRSTNSRSPKDIQRIMDAVEKGDWQWVVGKILSYRRSAIADKKREIEKHEVSFDSLTVEGSNPFTVAENIAYKNGYYSNGNSHVVDRIDVERVYRAKKIIFDKYGINEDNAIYYLTMASEMLRRDIDEIVDDSRFEKFLAAVVKIGD